MAFVAESGVIAVLVDFKGFVILCIFHRFAERVYVRDRKNHQHRHFFALAAYTGYDVIPVYTLEIEQLVYVFVVRRKLGQLVGQLDLSVGIGLAVELSEDAFNIAGHHHHAVVGNVFLDFVRHRR